MTKEEIRERVGLALAALALAVALFWIFGCASLQPGEKLALYGAAADLGTTAYGIHDGGFREANPLYGDGDDALARGVAITAVLHLAIRAYLKNKPPAVQERVWRRVGWLRIGGACWNFGNIVKEGS